MNFTTFEDKIGHHFTDQRLLETAFTHRSYLNENRAVGREHNERLEFLRAALVNTQSISDAGTKLGINEHLLLSRGESKDTGRARMIILANAFEALIGALYLDSGY